MSNVPDKLKYTRSHEWVKIQEDNTIVVGITDHAQDQLGDMVYIEVHETGGTIEAKGECAVVESVKAASEIYMPVSGEIIDANSALTEAPETVNKDPYGDGWLLKIKPSDTADVAALMDAAAYTTHLEANA